MNIQFPVSWLRDYLKTDLAAKSIAKYLTLSGPSVDRIENYKDDYIFDVEVTTNRSDAFSVYGIAKEANAILKNEKQNSSLFPPKGTHLNLQPDIKDKLNLEIFIDKPNLCHRFSAIILDNVKIKDSPAEIKNRLEASGIRSINNIVDISNYVMLELGQPMHTFDYDKIKGAKMTLRTARTSEKITTLDGINRKIPQGSIVISDKEKLIDLCGIMGGANSQITRRTKRVVLFVQSYNKELIRKTTQKMAFRTEAAARFEKGVDIENIVKVLSRAVYLAKKTSSAKIASELIDIYKPAPKPKEIALKFEKLNQYLGTTLSKDEPVNILKSLEFKVRTTNDTLYATPPTSRRDDTTEDVDLIEEIARIHGYYKLQSKLPTGEIQITEESILKTAISLKNSLMLLGLVEVITYSIVSKKLLAQVDIKEESTVELANPLTEEWQYMRPTIIPSHLEVIAKNKNIESDLKIFEIAKTYAHKEGNLPTQELMLTIVFSDSNFEEIKGAVENVVQILKREVKYQKLAKNYPTLEKEESAQIVIGKEMVGQFGLVRETNRESFGITTEVVAAELNLTKILASEPIIDVFRPIAKYPPVIEDISAIFDAISPLGNIVSAIKTASPLIEKVKVIDIFQNEKLCENKKSITFRITYQKPTATPSQDEVNVAKEKITEILNKSFNATIRS